MTIRSTFSRTTVSSLVSNMAWSNCMISAGLVSRLFPIAVFHCLATENRTRHGTCPFPSRPESANAQEFGRYHVGRKVFEYSLIEGIGLYPNNVQKRTLFGRCTYSKSKSMGVSLFEASASLTVLPSKSLSSSDSCRIVSFFVRFC